MKEAFALLQKQDPRRYHYFLWLKFIILNIFFVTVTAISYMQGWVNIVFAKNPKIGWLEAFFTLDSQTTYIFMMAGTFLVGWFLSVYWVYMTSREINYVKLEHPPEFSRTAEYLLNVKEASDGSRALLHQFLSEKWFSRIDVVRYVAVLLPVLGLLGTVLGFAIVSSGIQSNVVSDANAAANMVTILGKGLGVALYTTIVGCILGAVWLGGIYQIIRVGGNDFLNLLGERGEREVQTKNGKVSDVSETL